MNLYITKIPITAGFQDKTTRADILLCEDFEGETYATQLDNKEDFYEVINEYQTVGHVDIEKQPVDELPYSDSQWARSIRIPIKEIDLSNLTTQSEWNDFVSQF